jgi:hypothetical protein
MSNEQFSSTWGSSSIGGNEDTVPDGEAASVTTSGRGESATASNRDAGEETAAHRAGSAQSQVYKPLRDSVLGVQVSYFFLRVRNSKYFCQCL